MVLTESGDTVTRVISLPSEVVAGGLLKFTECSTGWEGEGSVSLKVCFIVHLL